MAVVTADPDYGKPATAVAGVVPLDNSGVRAVGNPTSLSGSGSLETALTQLSTYSPKWHRLESNAPGTWRFSCSIPDRAEPNKSRTFEAEGSTPQAAVQQVLDRIRQGP